MLKGLTGFDSEKIIIRILGGATATLSVDEFKRIDPAEGMNACLTMIDYSIFHDVMTAAFKAAFGRDTLLRLYRRLAFDVAGLKYGPVEELSDEEKSWLLLVSNGKAKETKDMLTIFSEKVRACLKGEVVATGQIGVVSPYQFVTGRASEAMEEKMRVLYANQLPRVACVRDNLPALSEERERLEELIKGLHRKYARKVP